VALPTGTEGVPTGGSTVTLVAADEGPLHPLALTLTVDVPAKLLFQVTVPVAPVPLIVPAVEGLIDQL
jgi:hypothetical protein